MFWLRVVVTVADHTSICTVYDFTVHPVSVHLPLTRLLASLYVLLDEPVEVSIAVCQDRRSLLQSMVLALASSWR